MRFKRISKPFQKSQSNIEMYELLYPDGSDRKPESLLSDSWNNILLCGPLGSGKSTLVKEFVSFIDAGDRKHAMHCSAAEIYLAVFINENDALLELAGNVPCLIIDDVEYFAQNEHGDELLIALFDKRNSEELHTILVSNYDFDRLEEEFPNFNFSMCLVKEISHLSKTDYPNFAKSLIGYYSLSENANIDDEAILYVCSRFDNLKDIDNAIHFLSKCSAEDKKEITVDDAKLLLKLEDE